MSTPILSAGLSPTVLERMGRRTAGTFEHAVAMARQQLDVGVRCHQCNGRLIPGVSHQGRCRQRRPAGYAQCRPIDVPRDRRRCLVLDRLQCRASLISQLQHFARSDWVAPPASMLLLIVVSAVENTGSCRAGGPVSTGMAGDLRIDTEILRLHQEFGAGPSRVDFTLRVTLSDNRSPGTLLVAKTRSPSNKCSVIN